MRDRKAGAPGRYRAVVPVEELENLQTGNSFEITLVRDDAPEEIGTPYNKASVLPDDVATAVCPDIEDPTPAEAFAALQQNKAPARYGIGKLNAYSVDSDAAIDSVLIDQINRLGEQTFKRIVLSFTTANNFTGGGGHYYADIYKLSTNYAIITIKSYILGGRTMQRIWFKDSNESSASFKPWEWDKPPLVPGVEYRTTERFDGKPVYVQAINFGTGGSDSEESANMNSLIDDLVRIEGYWYHKDTTSNKHPFVCAPFVENIRFDVPTNASTSYLFVLTSTGGPNYYGLPVVYYTKK